MFNVVKRYRTKIRVVVHRGPKKPYRHLGPYPCHYFHLESVYKKHEHLDVQIDAIFIYYIIRTQKV